jgi:hypothetical protein
LEGLKRYLRLCPRLTDGQSLENQLAVLPSPESPTETPWFTNTWQPPSDSLACFAQTPLLRVQIHAAPNAKPLLMHGLS